MSELPATSLFTPSLFHRIETDLEPDSMADSPEAARVDRPLSPEVRDSIAPRSSADGYFSAALAPAPYDTAASKTVTNRDGIDATPPDATPDAPANAPASAILDAVDRSDIDLLDLSGAGVEAQPVFPDDRGLSETTDTDEIPAATAIDSQTGGDSLAVATLTSGLATDDTGITV